MSGPIPIKLGKKERKELDKICKRVAKEQAATPTAKREVEGMDKVIEAGERLLYMAALIDAAGIVVDDDEVNQ